LARSRRQDRLQRFEAEVEALPFESRCARAYGQIYAAAAATGRKARGARTVDLYTLNAKDLAGIEEFVEIVDVGA